MGKSARKRKKEAAGQTARKAVPYWPLLILALIGVGLTGYLTLTAWSGNTAAACAAGSGCDVVLRSRWSTLFGQPTSFWGFLTYLSLAGIACMKRRNRRWRLAWILSLFGVLYSVYLTTISIVELKATCPYCVASATLMATIFALVVSQRPKGPAIAWRSWLPVTTSTGLLLVVALHLHYTGAWGTAPQGEDPKLRALALHLADSGAKFYGASWCPHCKEQKALFGASADRLPYIECSPHGRAGPQALRCRQKGVRLYPTWTINGRRYARLLTLKQLAAYSGFAD
ncbi:MAG: vitamin K epoxide reductase family protein, partial [Candidatus Methylomirabilales bacterium]